MVLKVKMFDKILTESCLKVIIEQAVAVVQGHSHLFPFLLQIQIYQSFQGNGF